jgi:uncharacterized membrane protein
MDCYFHHAVPSAAPCRSCGKAICASCRNDVGDCPACVLAARIDAATATRARIPGGVGASYRNTDDDRAATHRPAPPRREVRVQDHDDASYIASDGTRTLVALGYLFWPLAILALFDGTKSPAVRRHGLQAIAFSLFAYGVGFPLVSAIASIPLVGFPVWPLLVFWLPIVFVISAIYGFKAYHNERVDVPFISEFLDSRRTA